MAERLLTGTCIVQEFKPVPRADQILHRFANGTQSLLIHRDNIAAYSEYNDETFFENRRNIRH